MRTFRPKILDLGRDYSRRSFLNDLTAGVTVGIVALPLAMAFGIASGVPPQQGIFTAVIAGFLISLFSGSKVQIGGPTGAFVVIVFGVIQQYGYPNLLVCTLMAGVMLVAMGLSGMGKLIQFIPAPVTHGFTSGIGVVIALTQVKDFCGLKVESMPADFFEKMSTIASSFHTWSPPTLSMAAISLVGMYVWRRWVTRKLPGAIIVLLLATAFTWALDWNLDTIGTRFHSIPQELPAFALPDVTWKSIRTLISPAMTIAILAAIESLLCAVVADGRIRDRHNSNTELVAQGIANIAVSCFSGIPATGAIARTSTNIDNGGRTPIAGIIHALTLLAIMMLAAPLAVHVPLAVLSAILVWTAINMLEIDEWKRLPQLPRSDALVFITTFLLTVVLDLTVAVEIGLLLAAALFIKHASETTHVSQVTEENEMILPQHSVMGKQIPPGVVVMRAYGPLFFGAAGKLRAAVDSLHTRPDVLVIRMQKVPVMDATALDALEEIHNDLKRHGGVLILSAPHTQPLFMMMQADFADTLGPENITGDLDQALQRAALYVANKDKECTKAEF